MPSDHQAAFERVAEVLNRQEWDRFEEVFTEDWVLDYPQSGEVFRGIDNIRASFRNYPGGLPLDGMDVATARIAEEEQRWVMTPLFTVMSVEGSGQHGTALFRASYPDGSTWWVVALNELRASKVARTTMFFAPLFDAPDWRAPYREQP